MESNCTDLAVEPSYHTHGRTALSLLRPLLLLLLLPPPHDRQLTPPPPLGTSTLPLATTSSPPPGVRHQNHKPILRPHLPRSHILPQPPHGMARHAIVKRLSRQVQQAQLGVLLELEAEVGGEGVHVGAFGADVLGCADEEGLCWGV